MADTTTSTVLSIVAIGMSGLSLGWQVWTYFHSSRRQRQERLERVRATALVIANADKPVFAVDVYNHGTVDVYLRDVRLVWRIDDTERHAPLNLHGFNFLASPADMRGEEESLPQRKSERWALYRHRLDPLPDIIALPPAQVWVTVNSHGGEIFRIKGETVLPLLQQVRAAWGDELKRTAKKPSE